LDIVLRLCVPAGDVYFFCGQKMQYCTCSFRWNARGWYKAAVLWSFTLSTALGLQRLVIQLGLQGLLPGEQHQQQQWQQQQLPP
jgi:hypothetical protein